MRKVLVVFPIPHHESLVLGQCSCLNENGVLCDALLISPQKLKLYPVGSLRKPIICKLYIFLFALLRNIRGFYRLKIGEKISGSLLKAIINNYDVVELAGVYSKERLYYAKLARERGKKVIVRFWGTDFYGIEDYEDDWHKDLISIADKVVLATENMKNDFLAAYTDYNTSKISLLSYGLPQLETLKDIMDGTEMMDTSFLDEKAHGKIVLTVGYTGRPWQQHFYVLDALEKLSSEQKGKLFILVPMTYDSIPDYRLYVYRRLQAIGIPFQILDNRLPWVQHLSMRIISDIAVCVQFSDGLAASVHEHLMAGSIFIGGDWLPYNVFEKSGVYMKSTNKEELPNVIKGILDNYGEEKKKCRNNKDILYSLSSWNSKVESFVELYN